MMDARILGIYRLAMHFGMYAAIDMRTSLFLCMSLVAYIDIRDANVCVQTL